MNSNDLSKEFAAAIRKLKESYESIESIIGWDKLCDGIEVPEEESDRVNQLLFDAWRQHGRLDDIKKEAAFRGERVIENIDGELYSYYTEKIVHRSHIFRNAPLAYWIGHDYRDLFTEEQNEVAKAWDDLPSQKIVERNIAAALQFLQEHEICFENFSEAFTDLSEGDYTLTECNLENAEQFVESDLFHPDLWMQNLEAIRPIMLADREVGFDIAFSQRIEDLFETFIYGQYVAAIAMARSVLEFCLIDFAKSNGLSKRKQGNLNELTKFFCEKDGYIKLEEIDEIRDAGNGVMHRNARSSENVIQLPMSRTYAKRCIEIVLAVAERVYR